MSFKKSDNNIENNINSLSIKEIIDSKNKDELINNKGFDINLVININYLKSLEGIYKCEICQKILKNPYECEICGHNFCYNCITTYDCPFGCKNKKIIKSSNSIYNLLKGIKFKCLNIGCTDIIEYSEVEEHINECPYQKIKCINKGCNQIVIRKDIINHSMNECDFCWKKCKFCGRIFIKKEIKQHENNCDLIIKNKVENSNNDNNKIGLEEHLKRLSTNINEIINDNKKLVERVKANDKIDNSNPVRISIRKSIVPGLENDEFFDLLKEEIDNKIKEYYNHFNNNYQKILKEIEDIKPLLNQYIKNKENYKNEIMKNKEGINNYFISIISKIEKDLNNLIINYNENFSSEFLSLNNLLYKDIKQTQNNKNDIYSLINVMFTNLGKILFETNDKIKLLSNNILLNINDLFSINNKNNISIEQIKIEKLNKLIEDNNSVMKNQLENIINNKNYNRINKDEIKANKIIFLKNVNSNLIELQNNISQSINIINEKFTDFADKIKNTKIIKKNKNKFEICPNISFSLIFFKIPNTEIKQQKKVNNKLKNSEELIKLLNSSDKNKSISLDSLESQIQSLENYGKQIHLKIQENINKKILNNLNEINTKIEKDLDDKIDLMFSLKLCKECEKLDYCYGFMKCKICEEDFCKQCIVICTICKSFSCLKCALCKKCDKFVCKNCRTECISCHEYLCEFCISNCPQCARKICSNCISKCSLCNKNNFCLNCGKKCEICEKKYCINCIKNIKFSQCYLCINNACNDCINTCKEHGQIICNNCTEECNNCNLSFCKKGINTCDNCNKKFCYNCSKDFTKSNTCKFCKSVVCNDCIFVNNNLKCFYCNKKFCFKCSIKCINCLNYCCKECSNLCKNCNNVSCVKCSSECICGKYFCLKCISINEIIYPHECIYFSNNCAITESKKISSLNQIPNNMNIEAKFSILMNDISDKYFSLVGLINNNNFKNNNNDNTDDIFALNVNNGNKFSSKKGFESFLDFDDIKKGINEVYVMIKENKLFFKVNESLYKWAYDLNKNNNYWFYCENNINGSATKFIFIRRIK